MTSALLTALKKTEKVVPPICKIIDNSTPAMIGYGPLAKLRVSELYYMCSREVVFRNLLPTPDAQRVKATPSELMRMEVGKFLHVHLQCNILGPAGILFGNWRKGDMALRGYLPADDPYGWLYEEDYIEDEKLRLGGHLDGLVSEDIIAAVVKGRQVEQARTVLEPLEIKTTEDNKLRDVTKKEWHEGEEAYRFQATCYQHIAAKKRTLVLYLDRKYFMKHAFWYVGEDRLWDMACKKCTSIWESIEKKDKLPDSHPECLTPNCAKAKNCPYAKICYADVPEHVFELI